MRKYVFGQFGLRGNEWTHAQPPTHHFVLNSPAYSHMFLPVFTLTCSRNGAGKGGGGGGYVEPLPQIFEHTGTVSTEGIVRKELLLLPNTHCNH